MFLVCFIQSSAISRKLDKIHALLLKNADDLLYVKLKELAIPAQTYGMWVLHQVYCQGLFCLGGGGISRGQGFFSP